MATRARSRMRILPPRSTWTAVLARGGHKKNSLWCASSRSPVAITRVNGRNGLARSNSRIGSGPIYTSLPLWNSDVAHGAAPGLLAGLLTCLRVHDIRRAYRGDPGIGAEILDVEGQEVREAVDQHGSDESRIMGVLAEDRSRSDQLLPDAVDGGRLIEPTEQGFEARDIGGSFGRGLAQAVDAGRTGADDPELIEVLRDDIDFVSLRHETFHGINSLLMQYMARLGEP